MTLGWEIDPYGSHGVRLTGCLESTAQAPSVHNSQPWRLRVSPGRVDVLLDPARRLTAIDPSGREAWMSIGAAILNLRIAVLAAGQVPMTQLLPDPGEPDLAATIHIGGPYRPDETVRALATAIPRRRTNRRPFRDIPVRDEVLDQLCGAARVEGSTMVVTDPTGRESVLGLIRTANAWQRDDPAYLEELRQWTAVPAGSGAGIPTGSFGPVDDRDVLPLRDFGAGHPEVSRRIGRFEDAPTLAVLYTTGDGRLAWLRAGEAMERVLLTATVRGVASTPMTAPTELSGLRGLLTDPAGGGFAQIILRLGYGDPVPATPRRPIRDFVEIAQTVAR